MALDPRLEVLFTTIADAFGSTSQRSPVPYGPAGHGLPFEDVTFPSDDGTSLDGWFVRPRARATS